MCGIAGYIGSDKVDPARVAETLALMKNRGPDAQGHLVTEDGNVSLALLHTRLNIIDLDPRSNQPFTIGPYSLIFNGEIYSYVELKETLEKKGYHFKTTSDTEVLLTAYIEFGEECVHHFEGMWSFAIYDRERKVVFLSRDRFGEKPLYYLKTDSGIYFGSEIKLIKALSAASLTVNRKQLLRYLVNGYKSLYKTGETFFEEVAEIPYATNMTIQWNGTVRSERYWKPKYNPQQMALKDAVDGVREHLLESIRIRLRADVGLAFCLSGGVDSGAIVSIAAKGFGCDVQSFSIIDKDERYNELKNVQATINDVGCKNTIVELEQARSLDRLEALIAYHDCPLATISYYIHSFLSERIGQAGYKVVFSGTAADELLTGYYDHFNLHLYEMREDPRYSQYLAEWQEHVGKYVRNPYLQNAELYFSDRSVRDHIYLNRNEFLDYLSVEFSEDFSEKLFCESLLRNRMLNEIFHEVTPVILHEDDLHSMKYSIENRSPYLDTRLFEFAFSIPPEHLIRDGYGKYLLREAVKGFLNDEVRLDRQKKGFNAAIRSIIDFDAKDVREKLLGQSPIYELVKREKVEALFKEKELPNSFSKFLFNFINSKIFLELNA